jgi:outer membrane cobalamin receptor
MASTGRSAGAEAEPIDLAETVVVTASLTPETVSRVNRELLVVEGADLQRLPVRTIDDLLAFLTPLDLRPRVPGGLFGDVSLRGANESGVLVCIDGVRWNDPQTAHFNLEIPVPLELIDRVEVLSGSQSIFYGSDAVGGVINIITRRAPPAQAAFQVDGGSFGTGGVSALGSGSRGSVAGQVYAGWSRSDGFAPDRDYRIGQLMGSLEVNHSLGTTRVSYAHLDNRFGAAGFYGPYPSYEQTQTDAVWAITSLHAGPFRRFPTECCLSFKEHDDDFILIREQPDFYRNRHVTRTLLFQACTRLLQTASTSLAATIEAAGSDIASNRLSDHATTRWAAALEIQRELRPGLLIQGSLRLDDYSSWGARWTPGIGGSWFVRPSLKLRTFYGRAFRTPTFTELYYQSPGDLGNPDLQPEAADTVEAGLDWYAGQDFTLSATVFRRWDRNMIDWVRYSPDEPWQAVNIGRVDVRGASIQAAGTLAGGIRIQAGYNWNWLDPGVVEYQSKYALDYARHHVSVLLTAPLRQRTFLSVAVHHKVRADGRRYTPASVEIRQTWSEFELYARVDNLLGEQYEEIPGVAMPGRSFAGGIRLRHLFE